MVLPPTIWPVLVGAAVLLVLSAGLSAAETAIFSLGTDELETLEREGRHGTVSARALRTFRDETLMTILLTDYVANLALVVCVVMAVLRAAPGHTVIAAVGGGAISAAAILILGEYLPRAIGHCYRVRVALLLARPLVGLTFFAAPLRWLILTLANALFGLPGESALEREMGSEEEMKALITAGDLSGGLEEDERELISGVVEFGSSRAGDIMTPRPEICAFPITTPHEELVQKMRRSQFSRVLIYEETLDQVRGVLHVKDVLLNPETDYRRWLRKPLVVPESKTLIDLLREFRRHRVHLAVVCDEFGRTAGVVTMHDLLEEIVGELMDENRRASETIRKIAPAVWLVPGRADIDDLCNLVGLELPRDESRTVSGFVTNRLGRIPAVGDFVDIDGFRLTVKRMGVRRVALLQLERLEPQGDATDGRSDE